MSADNPQRHRPLNTSTPRKGISQTAGATRPELPTLPAGSVTPPPVQWVSSAARSRRKNRHATVATTVAAIVAFGGGGVLARRVFTPSVREHAPATPFIAAAVQSSIPSAINALPPPLPAAPNTPDADVRNNSMPLEKTTEPAPIENPPKTQRVLPARTRPRPASAPPLARKPKRYRPAGI